jgi:hypothetical protein
MSLRSLWATTAVAGRTVARHDATETEAGSCSVPKSTIPCKATFRRHKGIYSGANVARNVHAALTSVALPPDQHDYALHLPATMPHKSDTLRPALVLLCVSYAVIGAQGAYWLYGTHHDGVGGHPCAACRSECAAGC